MLEKFHKPFLGAFLSAGSILFPLEFHVSFVSFSNGAHGVFLCILASPAQKVFAIAENHQKMEHICLMNISDNFSI